MSSPKPVTSPEPPLPVNTSKEACAPCMLAVGLSIFAVGSLAAVKAARAPASSRKIVTWGWYGLAGFAGGYGFRTLSELTVKDGRLEVRPYA